VLKQWGFGNESEMPDLKRSNCQDQVVMFYADLTVFRQNYSNYEKYVDGEYTPDVPWMYSATSLSQIRSRTQSMDNIPISYFLCCHLIMVQPM